MTVSVVIPTYNVVELLEQNLPHVVEALEYYDKTKKNVELIVTDNHSSDNTIEYLKSLQEKISIPFVIIENSFNGGFAVNANRGVRAAKGEIVILLGSDVRPEKDFIKPLLSHFSNSKIFGVGCANHSDEDEGSDILRGRGVGKWEKGFLLHQYGKFNKDNTLWVDCGSAAFRKTIWDEIGGLQELYSPFYWEDVDLSYRAQKMGYMVKVEKKSCVIHEHKKGSIKKMKKSDFVIQTTYRNQFFFVWLNITDKEFILNHLLYLPYHLGVALKNKNWLFIKGFFQALLKLNKILSQRKKLQTKFTVSDKEILNRFKEEI